MRHIWSPRQSAAAVLAFVLAASVMLVEQTAATQKPASTTTSLAPGTARGTVSAGATKVSYTNAYAVLVLTSNTLILGCLDKALGPADIQKVAVFALKESTGVFKYGLSTVSTAIFEVKMPFKAGARTAEVAALDGFDLTLSNEPLDWTFRFATDPQLLKMNASASGNAAQLVELAGDLKPGGHVRGRLTGSGRDRRETPPTTLGGCRVQRRGHCGQVTQRLGCASPVD
jgi:hypothetical protein